MPYLNFLLKSLVNCEGRELFRTRPAGYFCAAVGLTEQTGEQRDEGRADQHHTAASHELLDALRLCLCVIKK